jgi:hypothetical protein
MAEASAVTRRNLGVYGSYPSTTLRVVPLPIRSADSEAKARRAPSPIGRGLG